jgi:hypothetical protein
MGRAKDIIVKVIPAKIANEFVKKHHYSGKVVSNSNLHFGAFLDGKLHGVLSYGSSLDKRKTIGLVEGTGWNEYLELNRMAFDEYLPKYSESRCISVSIKLIKKNAPHIKWILSYADGSQCGDGTIYRASGFLLTKCNSNDAIWEMPDGKRFCHLVFSNNQLPAKIYGKPKNISSFAFLNSIGAKKITGFQLRYIYLIDKSCKITVPILPFSKIDEMGAGMYKGEKITLAERQQQAQLHHVGDGAAIQPSGAFDSTAALNI